MPKLSQVGGSEALDNRYVDKTIVYVEAEADAKAFARIIGLDFTERLEFKTPVESGGGFMSVRDQVRDLRDKNPKVFGLVDGEAAASAGGLNRLLTCGDALFLCPDSPEFEGVLFLAEHELENILIRHGQVCEHIAKEVNLADLGKVTPQQIKATVTKLGARFFASAILKYAAVDLRTTGQLYDPVDAARYQGPESGSAIFRALKVKVEAKGLDWSVFVAQVYTVLGDLRAHFKANNLDVSDRQHQFLRLADGKGLMKRLKTDFKSTAGRWDGHLLATVVASDYAPQFRDELLTLTKAA